MQLEFGSTGNLPVPSGNLPLGTVTDGTHQTVRWLPSLPSGKLPDGTGQWPVLPTKNAPGYFGVQVKPVAAIAR